MLSKLKDFMRGEVEDPLKRVLHARLLNLKWRHRWHHHRDLTTGKTVSYFSRDPERGGSMTLYVESIRKWDAPFQEESVDDQDKARIVHDIVAKRARDEVQCEVSAEPFCAVFDDRRWVFLDFATGRFLTVMYTFRGPVPAPTAPAAPSEAAAEPPVQVPEDETAHEGEAGTTSEPAAEAVGEGEETARKPDYVYLSPIRYWDPPFDRVLLDDDERARIEAFIASAYAVQKRPYELR